MVDTCYILKAMVKMAQKVSAGFRGHNQELINQIKKESSKMDQEILIIAVNQDAQYLQAARHNIDKLLEAVEYKIANGILFSEKAVKELTFLFEGMAEYLVNIKDWLITGNKVLQDQVKEDYEKYANYCSDFATMHEERLIKGVCVLQASSVYLNMLEGMRGIFYNTGRLVN